MLVTIIIPVYNECSLVDEFLPLVIAADTAPYEREIIVIDDGSTDGTSAFLAKYSGNVDSLSIFSCSPNIGKAAAIKFALTKARGDIILIQDGDLEYSPADYPAILSPFGDPSIEVVYGSRFLRTFWPVNMKILNWLANRVFTGTVNLLYRSHITDEGTAYKAFRRKTLDGIQLESTGFEFCPEVTAKLLKKGITITEVPISYNARTRQEGKKPGIFDGMMILWTIFKYRFHD